MKVKTGSYIVGKPPTHHGLNHVPLTCVLHYCEHTYGHSITLYHTELQKYVLIDADRITVMGTNGTEEEKNIIMSLGHNSYLNLEELDGTQWDRCDLPGM